MTQETTSTKTLFSVMEVLLCFYAFLCVFQPLCPAFPSNCGPKLVPSLYELSRSFNPSLYASSLIGKIRYSLTGLLREFSKTTCKAFLHSQGT